MKCLSVCQPFADLIISGKKTIELRVWNTNFRGNFLVHSPLKVRTADCTRLGIDKEMVTGAVIGMAELYDVKRYDSFQALDADADFHHAGKDHPATKAFGFMLKNPKAFRVPVPYLGQLGFFEAKIPRISVGDSQIVSEIIDEEYRYQWMGRH